MKEIDITKLFKLLLSHIFPILLAGVVFGSAVFVYNTFWAKPVYRTSTSILINNGGLAEDYHNSGTISGGIISASLSIIPTCKDMLETSGVYKKLATALDHKYSYYELQSRFTVLSRNDHSLVLDIYTYGSEVEETKRIANTFLQIVPTYISTNLKSSDVQIMATADSTVKTSPNTFFNTVIAFMIGVLICAGIYILLDFTKNTIENEKDFKARYDMPLLGSVPLFESNTQGGNRRGRSK